MPLLVTVLINWVYFTGYSSCYANGTYTWYLDYGFMPKVERLVALGTYTGILMFLMRCNLLEIDRIFCNITNSGIALNQIPKTQSAIQNLVNPLELRQRATKTLVLSSQQLSWNGILVRKCQNWDLTISYWEFNFTSFPETLLSSSGFSRFFSILLRIKT